MRSAIRTVENRWETKSVIIPSSDLRRAAPANRSKSASCLRV